MSKSKNKSKKMNKKSNYQSGVSLFTKICAFALALLTVGSIFVGFLF